MTDDEGEKKLLPVAALGSGSGASPPCPITFEN